MRLSSRAPAVSLAPEHPLASVDGPLRLSDLADEPMVRLDAPPSSHHAMEVCQFAGFAPKIGYRTQNFETARGGRCWCSARNAARHPGG
ncbi:LysR substrate-binding domain-containing protein [Saccharomonospora sp. NB11]|uniref:LysR substrate-binding domain-containing protein n=1 Tax=Saccharomonospora sp. NB11 TaxID=1642298 RepID=UPI0027DE43D5|nr:LysR substrate-binding domain-containing protein [Saccharomonospora sp. NB11]